MTSLPVLVVLVLCGLLLGAAGWAVLPREAPLEGARWWHAVLGAQAEARGILPAAVAPWHPLGRFVERKVAHPSVETMPGALLPGELDLLQALARLPDEAARWRHLHGPEAVPPAPGALPELDPSRWLGPMWRGAWGDARAAVEAERRLEARWAFVAGPVSSVPSLGPAFEAFATCIDGAVGADVEAATARVGAALAACLPEEPGARLLIAAEGEGAWLVLRVLAADVALRDRVLAVGLVAGVLGGLRDVDGPLGLASSEDWNARNVRHGLLDTEVVRRTPWLSVGWYRAEVSPPGLPGLGLEAQRLPEPGFEGREPESLEVVDLGAVPVPTEARACEAHAAALRHVAALWALARSV